MWQPGNVVEVSLSPLTRKDGNSSSNQKSSHDSASSQAIRGNENILVNEMFKNELSPSVGNGSGGFVGGSGGLE